MGNVLAADRERWLAIDPKPYAGDPGYANAQITARRPDLRGMLSAFALTLTKHRSVRSVLIASAGS